MGTVAAVPPHCYTADMRGLKIGLSCFLLAATIAVVVGEEVEGVMKCQCSCDCPNGDSGCACDCDCPERGSTCAPGFTQVCPLTDGMCPPGMSEKCPGGGGGGGGGGGVTTTTTPPPPEIVTESVSVPGKVKCGKVSYTCSMAVTYMNDCSSVTSVKPTCSPKKKACTKKPLVTMTTSDGCTVTGKFASTSKGKQTMSSIAIAGGGSVTTVSPGGPTGGAADMQGCQCLPDFLIYWQKKVANDHEFACSCLPDEVMASDIMN